jgi:hypothetical protein
MRPMRRGSLTREERFIELCEFSVLARHDKALCVVAPSQPPRGNSSANDAPELRIHFESANMKYHQLRWERHGEPKAYAAPEGARRV